MGHRDGPTRWVMWCRLRRSKSNLYWVTNMLYSDDGTIDSTAWSMLLWICWNCEFAQFVTAVNSPSTCLLHNNPLTAILLLWLAAAVVYRPTVCFSASDVTCIPYISTVCSLQECTKLGHYQWRVLHGRWQCVSQGQTRDSGTATSISRCSAARYYKAAMCWRWACGLVKTAVCQTVFSE